MDSTCYLFPELRRAKAGRGARAAAACEFQRSGSSPTPGGRPAASSAVHRSGAPGGIEDLEQQAYCRGFDDGVRNGFEQGEKAGSEAVRLKLEHGLKSCDLMIKELEGLRRKAAGEVESELVELALAVSRKIVQHAITIAPEVVAGIVRQALNRVEQAARITIRLNPADVKLLSEISPPLTAGRPDTGRIALEADEGISRGGCLIETESGEVDARLERQFHVVEEAFRAEFERGQALKAAGA